MARDIDRPLLPVITLMSGIGLISGLIVDIGPNKLQEKPDEKKVRSGALDLHSSSIARVVAANWQRLSGRQVGNDHLGLASTRHWSVRQLRRRLRRQAHNVHCSIIGCLFRNPI